MHALQDWMQVNNTNSWYFGAYIANQQRNNCPHEGINAYSIPNLLQSRGWKYLKDVLGESAWYILKEVRWEVVKGVMEYLKKFHPGICYCKGTQWASLSGPKSEHFKSCRWLQGVLAGFWCLHDSCGWKHKVCHWQRGIYLCLSPK